MYILLCVGFLVGVVLASMLLVFMGTKAGKTLHHDVFSSVLGAPLSWHEQVCSMAVPLSR